MYSVSFLPEKSNKYYTSNFSKKLKILQIQKYIFLYSLLFSYKIHHMPPSILIHVALFFIAEYYILHVYIPNVFYSFLSYDQSDNTVINVIAQICWYIHFHRKVSQKWGSRWKCKYLENMLLNIFWLFFSFLSTMYKRTLICACLSAGLNFSQSNEEKIYLIYSTFTLNLKKKSKVFLVYFSFEVLFWNYFSTQLVFYFYIFF